MIVHQRQKQNKRYSPEIRKLQPRGGGYCSSSSSGSSSGKHIHADLKKPHRQYTDGGYYGVCCVGGFGKKAQGAGGEKEKGNEEAREQQEEKDARGPRRSLALRVGPRGAVGGCSNGSRVDSWWNPGSFCPSVSSPGPPPRIDEGPPPTLDNDFHFCNNNNNNSNNSNNRLHNNQYQQQQQHRNLANSLGSYVDSTRTPNGSDAGSDLAYGLISSSLQQQQIASTTDSRVDSSQRLCSPASSSTLPASPDSLNGLLSGYNNRSSCSKQDDVKDHATSSTNQFGQSSLLSSLLTTSRLPSSKNGHRRDSEQDNRTDHQSGNNNSNGGDNNGDNLLLGNVKLEYSEPRAASDVKVEYSPSADITAIDMKFETQSNGPPTTPSHLSVEPPHSSQGNNQGIVVGGSPAEVVGVDSMLLSAWGATGTEFLEAHDPKQTAAGLEDAWDTLLLGSSVGVTSAQTLTDLKPLPPFTGYTGHLSINGIPGHHYHTIASSAQRGPTMQSTSPSPTSNQEYYESSVVSSSTPCPQQQQQPSQQKHHQHQQHHQQQQQQLPQSTQQTVDYINNIEDLAEIIGSAMADTTVPGSRNGPGGNPAENNNGPSSEHDPEVSPRDWIDIAEWIDTACSPKTQETTSSSPYSQMYGNTATTPANPPPQAPPQQQHGSTLQSLLTHGYSPLLQQRLQATCGETPSSTSPYPPVSPPGRVSTSSCSPDDHHQLHSSFVTPQHPRRRSRPSGGGSGGHPPSKKSASGGGGATTTTSTTNLAYGTESSLIGGKEKPVHRCSICNRGFLNKSNIKVHLRTHTGEKPFRCEVCGKAFRQKAHLIKHQQIHKRIGEEEPGNDAFDLVSRRRSHDAAGEPTTLSRNKKKKKHELRPSALTLDETFVF